MTPTWRLSFRANAVSLSTSVLLPAPGGPVTPTRWALPGGLMCHSSWWLSSSLFSTMVISLARALLLPCSILLYQACCLLAYSVCCRHYLISCGRVNWLVE